MQFSMEFLKTFLRVARALIGDVDVYVYPMKEEALALEGYSESNQAILVQIQSRSEGM